MTCDYQPFVLLVLVISPGLSCKTYLSLGVVILSSLDGINNDSIVVVKWGGISLYENLRSPCCEI